MKLSFFSSSATVGLCKRHTDTLNIEEIVKGLELALLILKSYTLPTSAKTDRKPPPPKPNDGKHESATAENICYQITFFRSNCSNLRERARSTLEEKQVATPEVTKVCWNSAGPGHRRQGQGIEKVQRKE